jgi:hypothetical protein
LSVLARKLSRRWPADASSMTTSRTEWLRNSFISPIIVGSAARTPAGAPPGRCRSAAPGQGERRRDVRGAAEEAAEPGSRSPAGRDARKRAIGKGDSKPVAQSRRPPAGALAGASGAVRRNDTITTVRLPVRRKPRRPTPTRSPVLTGQQQRPDRRTDRRPDRAAPQRKMLAHAPVPSRAAAPRLSRRVALSAAAPL